MLRLGGAAAALAARRTLPRRALSFRATNVLAHGDFEWEEPRSPDEVVRVSVVTRDGSRHEMQGKEGDNLLYVFHRWRTLNPELSLEGACEASLACSTCHVIVNSEHFDRLDEATEEEEDMLDEATCLTDTSRLGCQIILSKELDGIEITLPAYSKNFYVDVRRRRPPLRCLGGRRRPPAPFPSHLHMHVPMRTQSPNHQHRARTVCLSRSRCVCRATSPSRTERRNR